MHLRSPGVDRRRRHVVGAWLAGLLVGVAPGLHGQEIRQTPADSDAPFRSLQPLPFVSTSPLTGIAGGVVINYLIAPAHDTITRPTQLRVAAIYTQNRQAYLDLGGEFWSRNNRWRITTELEFNIFPQPFYGIGPNSPTAVDEEYRLRSVLAQLRVAREVFPGFYFSLGTQFRVAEITDLVPGGGVLSSGTVLGATGGTVWTFEGILSHDTRDNVLSPHHGQWVQLIGTTSLEALGSGWTWADWAIDARQYLPLAPHTTLALMGYFKQTSGDVPFDWLPNIGGSGDLRAYINNRWRDRNALILQAELRQRLFWRIGMVGFAGAGSVAPTIAKFRLDEFHPSVGIGLRYRVVPSKDGNIRVDVGFGQNSTAIYVGFSEAY